MRYLGDTPVLQATKDDVNGWLDSRTPALSAKTRYNLLSMLGCFYKWAVLEELCETDPTGRIRRPKLRRYLPRPMPASDLEVALGAASSRMTAWLVLGAMSGLRCMEIANLDRTDLHEYNDPPVMIVKGKGGKERIVPLHPVVFMAIQANGLPRSGPLFQNTRGRRFTPAAVSQQINAHLHGLGIAASAHTLRHKFGTDIYRLSKDLRLTQELLGHASPTTTAVYAAWAPSESARVVEQLTLPVTA